MAAHIFFVCWRGACGMSWPRFCTNSLKIQALGTVSELRRQLFQRESPCLLLFLKLKETLLMLLADVCPHAWLWFIMDRLSALVDHYLGNPGDDIKCTLAWPRNPDVVRQHRESMLNSSGQLH